MTEQAFIQMLEQSIRQREPFGEMRNGTPIEGVWHRILMPEYCCANGEPYCCYLKKGRKPNLIIFMIGGGLLWDEQSAAYPATPKTLVQELPGLYTSQVTPANEYWFFASKENNGILSDDERNPFKDWSIGMVNYGTADFHLGAHDFEIENLEGEPVTIQCRGLRNLHGCMALFRKYLGEPEKLLLCGESAGGFAVPGVAEEILRYYPKCTDITLFTDSALMLRKDWKKIAEDIWKIPGYLSESLHSEDIVADLYERLIQVYGDRLRCLYACGRQDTAMAQYQNYMDGGTFTVTAQYLEALPKKLRKQYDRLHQLTDKFGFYYHDFPDASGMGSQHTTLSFPSFLEGCSDGVSPAKWLFQAVNGIVETVGVDLSR